MFPRINNRKAISVVMTTMIILVASVVLGTGVVIYGTSLFQTGGQTQSISSQGIKLWINNTVQTNTPAGNPFNGQYASWGAAAIRNNGDVLTTVNTIQIRGVTIPFSNWYVDSNQTQVTSGSNFQAQFNLTKTDQYGNPIGTAANKGATNTGGGRQCVVNGVVQVQTPRNTLPYQYLIMQTDQAATNMPLCLVQASAPVTLNPAASMIVFFKIPSGVITPVDAGSTVTANIYAGNVGGPTTITVANP
jgi:hypothetical protein